MESIIPGMVPALLRKALKNVSAEIDRMAAAGNLVGAEMMGALQAELLCVKTFGRTRTRTHEDGEGCWIYHRDGMGEGEEHCVQIY